MRQLHTGAQRDLHEMQYLRRHERVFVMSELLILLVIGWLVAKACDLAWWGTKWAVARLLARQPYQLVRRAELARLQDCELTLGVVIGEIDSSRELGGQGKERFR